VLPESLQIDACPRMILAVKLKVKVKVKGKVKFIL